MLEADPADRRNLIAAEPSHRFLSVSQTTRPRRNPTILSISSEWKPGNSTLRRRRTARCGGLDYLDCLSHFHQDLGTGTPGRSSSPLANLGWINLRPKWRYPSTSIASLIVQPSCSEINWLLLRSCFRIQSNETSASTICCSCCRDSGGIRYQSTRMIPESMHERSGYSCNPEKAVEVIRRSYMNFQTLKRSIMISNPLS
jgi:hypothetical protein